MNCVAHQEIQDTFSRVRKLSFHEKKDEIYDEERLNNLLDALLEFKRNLTSKTEKLNKILKKIEKLTWLDDLDDNCLMLINDIISLCRDLHATLIRQYVSFNSFRKKGIAKEEIKYFKISIDDLKETYEDLETIFFFLPSQPEFIEASKKLSLI